MRKTQTTVKVAMALLECPRARHWGYELSQRSGISPPVLYRILGSMHKEGWLADGWEDRSEIEGKRPPRRYYQITPLGLVRLGALVVEARSDQRFTSLHWRQRRADEAVDGWGFA